MRIAHLLRKLNPAEWGGTETAIQRLLDGLRAEGVTPIIYCPRLEQEETANPLREAGHQIERFHAILPAVGLSQQRRRQLVAVGGNIISFDLVASLWREQELDVIHSHALGRLGAIGRMVAKQRNLPLVITIHGGVLDLPEKVKQAFNSPVKGCWEWGKLFGFLFQSSRLFPDADAVLTCNPREAVLLQEKYPDKRIMVQPHAVNTAEYENDHRAAALKAFPEIRGRKVLLCLGRIDPIKNQGWLVDQVSTIMRKHPDALLVLAGPCTDEAYGETVRRNATNSGICFTGPIPPGDPRLIGLLQTAEALLLPSLAETFGLVIVEAWAAGTLTISSRTSGSSSLIEHGHNGWLFDLEHPESFHQALDWTLANADAAHEMARRGTEKVRQEYSPAVLARRMKGIYEELVEEKRCVT